MSKSTPIFLWTILCSIIFTGILACTKSNTHDESNQNQPKLSKEEIDSLWYAEVKGAQRLEEIRQEFLEKHPFKGQNTLAYLRNIKKEGFICRMQPYERVNYSDGEKTQPFGFYMTTEPSISCEQEPSQFKECKWFRVGIKSITPSWPDSSLQYAALLKQLSNTTIKNAVIVCNSKAKAADYDKFISDGIAKGIVIVIE